MAETNTAEVTTEIEQPAAETVVRPTAERKKKPRRQPRYHVILWNDDFHTHRYVITMLQKVFGHPMEKGMQVAVEVDTKGRAIVLTTTLEHAELKRDQIHAFGKDDLVADCQGSMSASIEAEVG